MDPKLLINPDVFEHRMRRAEERAAREASAGAAGIDLPDEVLASAMQRALTIAENGPTDTENPQVGCVILDPEGRIVAEGWHRGAGTPHAETDALAALSSDWLARAAELTAVVTLEPCNHTGRTGPCALTLADAGIGSVVYAISDPGDSSGGGADFLREQGVRVRGGVLGEQAAANLWWWLQRQPRGAAVRLEAIKQASAGHGRPARDGETPHIILKWAQTLDGRAYADDGSSQWITGEAARLDVHFRRAAVDAIITSTGTILADNPRLTARDAYGELLVPAAEQPMPVIFGNRYIPNLEYIENHPFFATNPNEKLLQYRDTHTADGLKNALKDLKSRGIHTVLIEAGPKLVSAFLEARLVDEFLIYQAPFLLGGRGVAVADIGIDNIYSKFGIYLTDTIKLGQDTLIRAVDAAR